MAVRVFSTSNCPHCVSAKKFLAARGVRYTELNVEKDVAAAREMVAISGAMTVPIIDINGKIIVGFNRSAICAALETSR